MSVLDDAAESTIARYRALARLSEVLRTYRDTDSLFASLARVLRDVVPFSFLGLALYDAVAGRFRPRVLDAGGRSLAPPDLSEGASFSDWVFEHGRPLLIPSLEDETRFEHRIAYLRAFDTQSVCCLPLATAHRRVGMLLAASRQRNQYPEQDVDFLSLVANQVALAIDGAQQYEALQASLIQERARLADLEASDALLRAISPALDVRDVFHQVSAIAKPLVPHDMAALILLSADRSSVTAHAVSGEGVKPAMSAPVPLWFQRSSAWDHLIYPNVQEDPLTRDGLTAKAGLRSALRMAVRDGAEIVGALEFSAFEANLYSEAHAQVGLRIASHVALALSHERLSEQRRLAAALEERSANLELLDGMLDALAGVLDVRQVFARLSQIVHAVIRHDMMALPLLTEDEAHITVHAVSGATMALPTTVPLPDKYKSWLTAPPEYYIDGDLTADPLERELPPVQMGMRSRLAVPVRLQGRVVGALDLFSREPDRFSKADALVGRRIADHVALALSHQKLAEEAQRLAEARERAAVLEHRVTALTAEVDALGGHRRVLGESRPWKQVLRQATQVAATDTTVLLLGESGTGKEVVARFLHRASSRRTGPFVAINCAALPEQLLESEIFGHERGAFTGALSPKPGQLELAASGVLFLDEVSEMSLTAQAKFLRVLQEREFQRLGGTKVLKTNVRVIAATNRDLMAAVARGTFREDLYYRLNVFEIHLPRLRDRADDVLPLSEAFLQDIGRAFGRPPAGISREARQMLMEYHWPGNVRQLRNTLERAAILCEGGLITGEHLSLPLSRPAAVAGHALATAGAAPPVATPPSEFGGTGDLRSMERAAIESALQETRHNKSKAARLLGLTRTQLYVRLRKHGLE